MMNKGTTEFSTVVGAAMRITNYCRKRHINIKKKESTFTSCVDDAESGRLTEDFPVFKHQQGFYEKFLKRPLDVICAGAALIILSPVMLVTAVTVRMSLGSPVFFVQERLGKDEIPFTLLKFRSMKNAYDEYGVPLPDQQRVTKTGKMIRKLSLDELPSLINIIKGDMSIVGPRPLPTNYGPWFYDNERKRHSVKGGLTGLAQVNGRNAISWEQRFDYDIKYVDHITFLGDIKIILKTVEKVLKRSNIGERGVNSAGDFHVLRSGMTEQELLVWEKNQKEKAYNA